MAFDVVITPGAEWDIRQISDYIGDKHSAARARKVRASLLTAINSLSGHPEGGPHPDELVALGVRRYRQILSPPYRIVYRAEASRVFVLVVADGRRDMKSLLARRLLAD
jgi:toxin ParE1/3/4